MRTLTPLIEDTWTDLGTGEMVIEITQPGPRGRLLLNQQQDEPSAMVIPWTAPGLQIANTNGADTIWARADGPGWTVTVDI